MTAAADELVVTQPSVSSAIAALSRELGCELFERAGRGIRLTEAGRAFRPYAEDVVGLLDDGRHAAREAAGVAARRMRIAAVTTAAESFVPPLMRVFASRHPDVELTLDVGNREYVFERVLEPPRGRRDLRQAAGGRAPGRRAAAREPDRVHHRARRPAGRGGPGRRGRARRTGPGCCASPGPGTRALGEQFLDERGLSPRTLTLGSNGAIKQAARAGLGVSLLSRAAVEPELTRGGWARSRSTDGPAPRPWFVLRSAVGPVRPARRDLHRVRPWRGAELCDRAAGFSRIDHIDELFM